MTGSSVEINPCDIMVQERLDPTYSLVVVDPDKLFKRQMGDLDGVFLVTNEFQVLWQISVPLEEQRKHNPENQSVWSFTGLVTRQGTIYAQHFDGALFDINMKTGQARYWGWTK